MTPPQSAPPVSDLEDLASIPLAASIVNLTDEENGLTPTIELTWNLMLMIRLMWKFFLKSLRMSETMTYPRDLMKI